MAFGSFGVSGFSESAAPVRPVDCNSAVQTWVGGYIGIPCVIGFSKSLDPPSPQCFPAAKIQVYLSLAPFGSSFRSPRSRRPCRHSGVGAPFWRKRGLLHLSRLCPSAVHCAEDSVAAPEGIVEGAPVGCVFQSWPSAQASSALVSRGGCFSPQG